MEFLGTDYRYFPKENTYKEVKIRKKELKLILKLMAKMQARFNILSSSGKALKLLNLFQPLPTLKMF